MTGDGTLGASTLQPAVMASAGPAVSQAVSQAEADLALANIAQQAARHRLAVLRGSSDFVAGSARVFVVDHDPQVRATLRSLFEAHGLDTQVYADGAEFLNGYRRRECSCLLADTALADLGGLALLRKLSAEADPMPVIMITDSNNIAMAVAAMKAGAADFIKKPLGAADLVASLWRALAAGQAARGRTAERSDARHHFNALTARQHQIMNLVLAGHPSKNIAADLGISRRTVENHRAAIMRKSGSKSLPALARLALAAEPAGAAH